MPLNVHVKTSETSGAGVSTAFAGTAFVVGEADQGPSTYVSVQSTAQLIEAFGPRTAGNAKLFDQVQTILAIGGVRCYVARVTDSTAVIAKLVLKDATSKPTLVASAKTAGIAGNGIKVEVVEAGSEYELVVTAGEETETSPEFTTQAQAIEWSSESALVTLTAATESEHTTNIPKALAAASLAGGVDASDLTDTSFLTTANTVFPGTLGPGQLLLCGRTTLAAHIGMALHCRENNRWACYELADATSAASLIAERGTITLALQSYGGFVSSSAIIPGLVPGTDRTVAGSAVLAAQCGLASKTGNNSTAPAGEDFAIPYILGFTNLFTEPEMEALQEAGINPFAVENGQFVLDGFYTAVSKDVDEIFWQASAARERMALQADGEAIAARYRRKPLGGRKSVLGKFQGDLQGLIKTHWEAGALDGESAAEAGTATTGEPVNTPQTIQAGELNAELEVEIVPFANQVNLNDVIAPVTETL